MEHIIPDLLLNFRTSNPDIVCNLKEMDNKKQIESLLNYSIDIGFVRLEHVPSSIAIKTVLKDTFCLVLPNNHPIHRDNFNSLRQCKEDSFILFDPEYSASYYDKVMQIFRDAGFTPQISHLTIHASSIYKLVAHNFGISIVPKSLTSHSIEGIKFIELDSIPQRTELSLVWNTTNRNPILHNIMEIINKLPLKH